MGDLRGNRAFSRAGGILFAQFGIEPLVITERRKSAVTGFESKTKSTDNSLKINLHSYCAVGSRSLPENIITTAS